MSNAADAALHCWLQFRSRAIYAMASAAHQRRWYVWHVSVHMDLDGDSSAAHRLILFFPSVNQLFSYIFFVFSGTSRPLRAKNKLAQEYRRQKKNTIADQGSAAVIRQPFFTLVKNRDRKPRFGMVSVRGTRAARRSGRRPSWRRWPTPAA